MRISDWSSDVCSSDLDASNENAELFLQLAGAIVARMETQAMRGRSITLTAPAQQDVLLTKAREIMNGWAFPFARQEMGRAHVCTTVTYAQLVCRLLLADKKRHHNSTQEDIQ